MKRFRWLLVLLLIVALTIALVGCSQEKADTPPDDNVEDTPDDAPKDIDEFNLVAEVGDEYLNSGKPVNISAEDVYNNVVVGGDTNYVILSIRRAEHFAQGHIEGAMNLPYGEMYKQENLDQLPQDKTIIVQCYTGNTASQITAYLNMLGYNAVNLKFGMLGWNEDALFIPGYDGTAGFPVVQGADEVADTYDFPVVLTGETDINEIIKVQAEAYLTSGQPTVISVEDLYNNVVVGGDSSYQIVSIRSAEDYEAGHIEGAINIPFKGIAKFDNLKRLDPDKKIAVYCYTGHTGAQATMILNLLGYEAYNVKFGMMAWNEEYSSSYTPAPGLPVVVD